MKEPTVCGVCGLPVDRHSIEIQDGAAQAVIRNTGGRTAILCSIESGSGQALRAEIRRLRTIVRSLRYRATRARNTGAGAKGHALEEYADVLNDEYDRLVDCLVRWYPWYPYHPRKERSR